MYMRVLQLAMVACSYRYRIALRVNRSLGCGWVFLASFNLNLFLNDALAATSQKHVLSERMRVMRRYDCGFCC